jgi:cyclohexa-1,5-dienecarbonyl-CoA hydratase
MTSDPSSENGVTTTLLEDQTLFQILLDRPKGNILTSAMMSEVSRALSCQRDSPRLRLVVIRSAGPHFSFGTSIAEHRRDAIPEMLSIFHSLIREVASYPVPIAALVQGSCLGGAFELVLCCHFVFATSDAQFGCPEIKLGVFAPVLAAIGAHRLGGPLAERLLLTGALLDTEEARQAGLLTKVLSANSDPAGELLAWYRKHLRSLSAFALRQATSAARKGCRLVQHLEEPLARLERQYLDEVVNSRDGNEGIEAFLKHRSPTWQDS